MFCPNCGEENEGTAKFCSNCGYVLAADTPTPKVKPPAGIQYPPPQPPVPGPYQANYPVRPMKDRSLALILEILLGIFGLLGIGWIYSGNTGTGVAWLIGMIVWDIMAIIIISLTLGFGLICTLPISIALIAISAVSLNNYTKSNTDIFGP